MAWLSQVTDRRLHSLQGKALQELKAKIELLEGELDAQSLGVTAAVAEKDANFSLLQEALQRAEVRQLAIFAVSMSTESAIVSSACLSCIWDEVAACPCLLPCSPAYSPAGQMQSLRLSQVFN